MKFLKSIYRYALKVLETRVLGSRLQEWVWKTRHIYKGRRWLEEGWQTKDSPAIKDLRHAMVEKIKSYNPQSVLDFGCGTGPQLYFLSKELRETKFLGLDVNKSAVMFGQKKFKEENINNVELICGTADYLNKIPDKSFDVFYTMAVMFYIGPDKIESVARNMLRISRKAIILAEPNYIHTEQDKRGQGVYVGGHWLRNFSDLFALLGIDIEKIKVTDATKFWANDSIGKFASIIEIEV